MRATAAKRLRRAVASLPTKEGPMIQTNKREKVVMMPDPELNPDGSQKRDAKGNLVMVEKHRYETHTAQHGPLSRRSIYQAAKRAYVSQAGAA